MSYTQAVESRLSKPQIYAFAESIATQLGFSGGDDIHALVRRMGGKVEIADTLLSDPEQTGSLYVEEPSNFLIVVPSHTSPERDRFTIAHELGHYVLHYLWAKKNNPDLPKRVVAYRKGSDRIEWEANWFAAAFLMPKQAFHEVFKDCDGDLASIARHFRVSTSAAEIRARGLGLID